MVVLSTSLICYESGAVPCLSESVRYSEADFLRSEKYRHIDFPSFIWVMEYPSYARNSKNSQPNRESHVSRPEPVCSFGIFHHLYLWSRAVTDSEAVTPSDAIQTSCRASYLSCCPTGIWPP